MAKIRNGLIIDIDPDGNARLYTSSENAVQSRGVICIPLTSQDVKKLMNILNADYKYIKPQSHLTSIDQTDRG